MEYIEMSSSLTSIGEGAFQSCTGLKNLSIPTSVTTINQIAFDGCTGLVFIDLRNRSGIIQAVVRPENEYYDIANELKSEYVIEVIGTRVERESKNDKLLLFKYMAALIPAGPAPTIIES